MRQAQGLSERRACRLVGMARTSCRYELRRPGQQEKLRARLRALAGERRRFGYRRLTVLLRREGWTVNHKRVYRLYGQERLQVRRRKRQRMGAVERRPITTPIQPNQRWSMDFVSDALSDGRKFRSLNIVDDFNRECLAAEVDTSLPGARVVRVLNKWGINGGQPELRGLIFVAVLLLPYGFHGSDRHGTRSQLTAVFRLTHKIITQFRLPPFPSDENFARMDTNWSIVSTS